MNKKLTKIRNPSYLLLEVITLKIPFKYLCSKLKSFSHELNSLQRYKYWIVAILSNIKKGGLKKIYVSDTLQQHRLANETMYYKVKLNKSFITREL